MATRAVEILKQAMRELAQEEGASVGEVLEWAGAAEAARLDAGGGGGGLTVLGPHHVAHDAPGLVNASNNGIETIAIAAGTLVLSVILIPTESWTGPSSGADVQIYISMGVDPDGGGPALGAFQPGVVTPGVAALANHVVDAAVFGASAEALAVEYQNTPALAIADCYLLANFVASEPVTEGAFDLYALVWVPA